MKYSTRQIGDRLWTRGTAISKILRVFAAGLAAAIALLSCAPMTGLDGDGAGTARAIELRLAAPARWGEIDSVGPSGARGLYLEKFWELRLRAEREGFAPIAMALSWERSTEGFVAKGEALPAGRYRIVVEARRGRLLLGRATAEDVDLDAGSQDLSLELFEICTDLAVAVTLPSELFGAEVSVIAVHDHAPGLRGLRLGDGTTYVVRGMYPGGTWRVIAVARDKAGALYGAELPYTPGEDRPYEEVAVALTAEAIPPYVAFVPADQGPQDIQAMIDSWQAGGTGQPLELRLQEGVIQLVGGIRLPTGSCLSGGWTDEDAKGGGTTTLRLPSEASYPGEPWSRRIQVSCNAAVFMRDLIVDADHTPYPIAIDGSSVRLDRVDLVNAGYPDWDWPTGEADLASFGRYAMRAFGSDVNLNSCNLEGAIDAAGEPLAGYTIRLTSSTISGGRNHVFGVRLAAEDSSFMFSPAAGWDTSENGWSTVIGGAPLSMELDGCTVSTAASSEEAGAGSHLTAISVVLRDLPSSYFAMRASSVLIGYATNRDASFSAVEVMLARGSTVDLDGNLFELSAAPQKTGQRPRSASLVSLFDKGTNLSSPSDVTLNVTGNEFVFLADADAGSLLANHGAVATWWGGEPPLRLATFAGNLFRAPYADAFVEGQLEAVPFPVPLYYDSASGPEVIGWDTAQINDPALLFGDATHAVPDPENTLTQELPLTSP